MKNPYKFRLYDSKTKPELRLRMEKIIRDLETYGHSIHSNDQVNRLLSRRFGIAVKDEIVSLGWNRYTKKSIIALYPGFRLIRLGDTYVSLVRKDESK